MPGLAADRPVAVRVLAHSPLGRAFSPLAAVDSGPATLPLNEDDAPLPFAPPNLSNTSTPQGSADLVPITAAPRIVGTFNEDIIKMVTGQTLRLAQKQLLFRKALIYGIASFGAQGAAPNANANVVYLGYGNNFLPIQVQPYAGQWSYSLEALSQHVFDLSQFFVSGVTGDGIFYTLE